MPVKIRCPECEHGLSLPDKARGRAIKCPECGGRVDVPGGQKRKPAGQAGGLPPRRPKRKRPAAAAAKSPREDGVDENLLANISLDRVEDDETIVCPACGQVVTEEDITCPKCYVDIDTGRLSETMRQKKARGGPDPDKFYEKVFGDALEFTKGQTKLAVRTLIYGLITTAIAVFCLFMVVFVSRVPLKAFFLAIAFMVGMVPVGWAFCVHISIIKSYFDRHNKKPYESPRYDFFLCSALGNKFFAWVIGFGLPFHVLPVVGGILLANNGETGLGIAVGCLGLIPLVPLFPLAMSHFAMPIQSPGWAVHKLLPIFLKDLTKPALTWTMYFVISMLPVGVLLAVIGAAFGNDLVELLEDADNNARIAMVQRYKPPKSKVGETSSATPYNFTATAPLEFWFDTSESELMAGQAYIATLPEEQRDGVELDFQPVIGPIVCLVFAVIIFPWVSIFNMRTNALFTRYFRPELDLITQEKETVFVRKKKKKDDDLDDF